MNIIVLGRCTKFYEKIPSPQHIFVIMPWAFKHTPLYLRVLKLLASRGFWVSLSWSLSLSWDLFLSLPSFSAIFLGDVMPSKNERFTKKTSIQQICQGLKCVVRLERSDSRIVCAEHGEWWRRLNGSGNDGISLRFWNKQWMTKLVLMQLARYENTKAGVLSTSLTTHEGDLD